MRISCVIKSKLRSGASEIEPIPLPHAPPPKTTISSLLGP